MTTVDGNAVAGALAEVFGRDLTDAEARCAGCGSTGPLAAAVAVLSRTGAVVRCRDCDTVLLTVVRDGGSTWLSMPGTAALHMADA